MPYPSLLLQRDRCQRTLAMNHCVYYIRGMSNAEVNQVWSEIGAAVVDLDMAPGIKNKYQDVVDFIRHETINPLIMRRYNEQILEQKKYMMDCLKGMYHLVLDLMY